MHDVAEFLSGLPPFGDLDEDTLAELAAAVEIEYFAAGATIFHQGEGPIEYVRIIRSGTVELVEGKRVLDLLGAGELFGHPSMLSGLPAGFEARAADDVLCYRVAAPDIVPLLSRPAGLRYVARSLMVRPRPELTGPGWGVGPAQEPVAHLLHRQPVICDPTTTIKEAAARMADAGSSSAVVRPEEGPLGILTDHDLRDRVIARGGTVDAPVTEVMSSPAVTVGQDRAGPEVMLEMLERGVRHVIVTSPFDDVLGVLTDRELLEAETQAPFSLRRDIADANDLRDLKVAAERLPSVVFALHGAGVPPDQIGGVTAIITDSLTRRLIDLTQMELGAPTCPFTWLALGSMGRREVVPSSDVDSALVWDGDEEDDEQREYMATLGQRVVSGLEECGFRPDAHGATAARPIFARSAYSWRRIIRGAIAEPTENKGLVVLSLLLDARVVKRTADAEDILDELRQLDHRRSLIRLMLRLALAHKPPTGFLRDFVVAASGEHRGQLDIKHGGMLPIGNIARCACLASGSRVTSTHERLELASTAGVLDANQRRTMQEAYDLFWRQRLEHQFDQLRAGVEADDFLDPKDLNPLMRSYLRDAFHAVRKVQRSLENSLTFG